VDTKSWGTRLLVFLLGPIGLVIKGLNKKAALLFGILFTVGLVEGLMKHTVPAAITTLMVLGYFSYKSPNWLLEDYLHEGWEVIADGDGLMEVVQKAEAVKNAIIQQNTKKVFEEIQKEKEGTDA